MNRPSPQKVASTPTLVEMLLEPIIADAFERRIITSGSLCLRLIFERGEAALLLSEYEKALEEIKNAKMPGAARVIAIKALTRAKAGKP